MDDLNTISSPSKARQAASQAKDWAYVTNWLKRKYTNSPNPIPNFERNEDTLRVLLNFAAANDTADDEEASMHRAREETVRLMKRQEKELHDPKISLLEGIQAEIDDKSASLLQDLAETAMILGVPTANVGDLDRSLIDLSREEFETVEQLQKSETLQKYLENELSTLHMHLEEFKDDQKYETPTDLPAKTSEWLRSKRIAEAKAEEYHKRIVTGRSLDTDGPKIDDLILEEEEIVRFRDEVRSLEGKIRTFHGLSSNAPGAISEFRKLERELSSLLQERDKLSEVLVEKSH